MYKNKQFTDPKSVIPGKTMFLPFLYLGLPKTTVEAQGIRMKKKILVLFMGQLIYVNCLE